MSYSKHAQISTPGHRPGHRNLVMSLALHYSMFHPLRDSSGTTQWSYSHSQSWFNWFRCWMVIRNYPAQATSAADAADFIMMTVTMTMMTTGRCHRVDKMTNAIACKISVTGNLFLKVAMAILVYDILLSCYKEICLSVCLSVKCRFGNQADRHAGHGFKSLNGQVFRPWCHYGETWLE